MLGFFPALGGTIRDLLFAPHLTCRGIGRGHPLGRPLSFFLTMSLLMGIVLMLIYGALILALPALMPQMEGLPADNPLGQLSAFELPSLLFGAGVGLIVLLVGMVVYAFVASLFYHILLLIFGGAQEGFSATFGVFCYVTGATWILGLIPCVGGFVQVLWALVSLTLGFAAAHKTSVWRPILANALILFVCCGLYAGIYFFSLSMQATLQEAMGMPTLQEIPAPPFEE